MTVLGCRRLSEQQELMTSVKPMRCVSWLLGSRRIWRQRLPWARSSIRVRLLKRAVAFPTFFLDNGGMALIVFLRGVNVGGHRTFRPSILARETE
jgi:hypothetical protein